MNSPEPTRTLVGEMLVKIGVGLPTDITSKFCAVEVPPPGEGFVTVIGNVPPVSKSLVKITAVN